MTAAERELARIANELISEAHKALDLVAELVSESGRQERSEKRIKDAIRDLELWHVDSDDRLRRQIPERVRVALADVNTRDEDADAS
jgi:hypothetical protein